MKTFLHVLSRFTLPLALSAVATACGGTVLLDGEPTPSPDGGPAPTPSGTVPTPPPSGSTPTVPPTPGACTTTPITLATLPSRRAIGIALGSGYVAVLAEITGPSVPPVALRDVHMVPIGTREAPKNLGSASPLTNTIEARDKLVYFAQGTGIAEHDLATGKTRQVTAAVGPFAVTGSDIFVATADTRSLPPQSTITAYPLGPITIAPRTIAKYVGEAASLSARGNEWGAVLTDGRVAQGAGSGDPAISMPRGARGPGRVTNTGFVVDERLTCAEATCNQARVTYYPLSTTPTPAPPNAVPYTEAAFTTIQAFYADDKGAVFHAAVASGEELRAREAIVTHGGPGGAFTTVLADTGRPVAAITASDIVKDLADLSCVYWVETDTSDPAPGAETTVVRMVKR